MSKVQPTNHLEVPVALPHAANRAELSPPGAARHVVDEALDERLRRTHLPVEAQPLAVRVEKALELAPDRTDQPMLAKHLGAVAIFIGQLVNAFRAKTTE